jgi:Fe-S-cluster containining protein
MQAYNSSNGVCRYLENNLCEIYEKRPLICNVDKIYKRYFKHDMTEMEFVLENLNVCLKLAIKVGDTQSQKKISVQIESIITNTEGTIS